MFEKLSLFKEFLHRYVRCCICRWKKVERRDGTLEPDFAIYRAAMGDKTGQLRCALKF